MVMIDLNRIYLENATIGVWTYGGEQLFSIERPWRNNRPNESCIPEMQYIMERRDSPRFGPNMWQVADVPGRTHILVHVANYPSNVLGCIGLGLSVLGDLGGVGSSRAAIKRFYDWSDGVEELKLTIRSGINAP
jgi:hypothetical protein